MPGTVDDGRRAICPYCASWSPFARRSPPPVQSPSTGSWSSRCTGRAVSSRATRFRSQKSGDFLTSPEVSPLFGETIARFVASEHERIGDPFVVVEVGAGLGLPASPAARGHALRWPMEAWAVDVSPAARARPWPDCCSPTGSSSDLDDLPDPIRGVVIANELIDNLPMAIAQLTEAGWRERWVGDRRRRV